MAKDPLLIELLQSLSTERRLYRNANGKAQLESTVEFAEAVDADPGEFTRLAAYRTAEQSLPLLRLVHSPWPLKNPRAVLNRGTFDAARSLVKSGFLVVAARDDQVCWFGPEEKLLAVGELALATCTFDKYWASGLAAMSQA